MATSDVVLPQPCRPRITKPGLARSLSGTGPSSWRSPMAKAIERSSPLGCAASYSRIALQFDALRQPLQARVLGHTGDLGDPGADFGDAHQRAGGGIGQRRNTDPQLVQAVRQTEARTVQRSPRRLPRLERRVPHLAFARVGQPQLDSRRRVLQQALPLPVNPAAGTAHHVHPVLGAAAAQRDDAITQHGVLEYRSS